MVLTLLSITAVWEAKRCDRERKRELEFVVERKRV